MRKVSDGDGCVPFLGVLGLLVCLQAAFTNAQSVDPIPVHFCRQHLPLLVDEIPVKQLCGRLNSVGDHGLIVPAPNTEIKLYKANAQLQCCNDLKLVAERGTAGDGTFDFGDIPPGEYWLAVARKAEESVALVKIDARNEWPGKCEAGTFLIDEKYHSIEKLLEGTVD